MGPAAVTAATATARVPEPEPRGGAEDQPLPGASSRGPRIFRTLRGEPHPVVAAVAGVALGTAVGYNIANVGPAADTLAGVYGVRLGTIGFLTTALFVTHLVMQIPGGRLIDRHGAHTLAQAALGTLVLMLAGLAAIGVGMAALGVGNVFGSFLESALRNPAAADGQQGRLFIGFAAAELLGLLAQVVHEGGSHDPVGEPGEVFYKRGGGKLPARLRTLEHEVSVMIRRVRRVVGVRAAETTTHSAPATTTARTATART